MNNMIHFGPAWTVGSLPLGRGVARFKFVLPVEPKYMKYAKPTINSWTY